MSCCNSNYNINQIVNRLSDSSFGRMALGSGMLSGCICCSTPREFAPEVEHYAKMKLLGQEALINYSDRCCRLHSYSIFY